MYRSLTVRDNVSISVQLVPQSTQAMILTQVEEFLNSQLVSQDKAIIYCTAVQRVNDLATKLQNYQPVTYYAAKSDTEKKHSFDKFFGDGRLMIATSAFGLGIDNPRIKRIFIDGCYSLLDLAQFIGRAGRDGSPSHAVIFVCHNDRFSREQKLKDKEAFINWAINTKECRKQTLALLLDGERGLPCAFRPRYNSESWTLTACDVCKQISLENVRTVYTASEQTIEDGE